MNTKILITQVTSHRKKFFVYVVSFKAEKDFKEINS